MEQYIILSLALSGVLGVIGAAAHPVLSREAQLAIGALCLISLAVPIIGAVSELSHLPPLSSGEAEAVAGEEYKRSIEAAFCEGTRAYIASEHGLSTEDIEVELSGFDECAMRADGITVILKGRAALADARAIREAVAAELVSDGGECRVVTRLEKG